MSNGNSPHSVMYSTEELQEKQIEVISKLEAEAKSSKPIHLIVGSSPNDVKLMCGDIDLAKETFISSISMELTPGNKKLVIEFFDFTAEIEATPPEINKPSNAALPKWLPESDKFLLGT